jgi:hypothetical protein
VAGACYSYVCCYIYDVEKNTEYVSSSSMVDRFGR